MAVSISQVRRWGALAAALALVSLTLAACGGGSGGGGTTSSAASSSGSTSGSGGTTTQTQSSATSSGGGGGSTLAISATESSGLGFSQRTLTARAGTVTIRLANGGDNSLPHGIAIEGNGVDKDGKTVQPGGTSTVTVRLKPGRYTFYCPVPGHEGQGMKGTLTVT
ncbi:MAG: plastocyanin/azurin family copper-binding protein [Conexibacter sp.]